MRFSHGIQVPDASDSRSNLDGNARSDIEVVIIRSVYWINSARAQKMQRRGIWNDFLLFVVSCTSLLLSFFTARCAGDEVALAGLGGDVRVYFDKHHIPH